MFTDFLETGRKSYQDKHPKLIEAGEGRSGQGATEQRNVWQQQWMVKMIKVGW